MTQTLPPKFPKKLPQKLPYGHDDPMWDTYIQPLNVEKDIAPAPLALYNTTVQSGWIDYNGHMTESTYILACGYAYEVLAKYIGVTQDYAKTTGSYFTAETHAVYKKETRHGEPLHITTQILGANDKSIHIYHTVYQGIGGDVLFTCEQMQLHVCPHTRKVIPAEKSVLHRIYALQKAHSSLPYPENAGKKIEIRSKS